MKTLPGRRFAFMCSVLLMVTFVNLSVLPPPSSADPDWLEVGRYFTYRIVSEVKQPAVITDVTTATLVVIGLNATHVQLRSMFQLESNGSAPSDMTYDVVRMDRAVVQMVGKKSWLWLLASEAGPGDVLIASETFAWSQETTSEIEYVYSDVTGNSSMVRYDKVRLWLNTSTNHRFDRDPLGIYKEAWINQTLMSTGIGPNPGPTPPQEVPPLPDVWLPLQGGSGGRGSTGSVGGGGGTILSHQLDYDPPWSSSWPSYLTGNSGWWCGHQNSYNFGWQNRLNGHFETNANAYACDWSASVRGYASNFWAPGPFYGGRFTLSTSGSYRFQWHWERTGFVMVNGCQFTPYGQCRATEDVVVQARVYRMSDGMAMTATYSMALCNLVFPGFLPGPSFCSWPPAPHETNHVNLYLPSNTGWISMSAGDYYSVTRVWNLGTASVGGWGWAQAGGTVQGVMTCPYADYCGGLHSFTVYHA